MRRFKQSWFVITFLSECPESICIRGWENALRYIDRELGLKTGDEWSFFNPCAKVHDVDNWTTLGGTRPGIDDERHTFSEEVDECVTLQIVRITEPMNSRKKRTTRA